MPPNLTARTSTLPANTAPSLNRAASSPLPTRPAHNTVFLANGNLNYVQDTDGNRITLGYNGSNQLVTLTYSNPGDPSGGTERLTLAYYTSGPNIGLVKTVTDGTGDTWNYYYDGAGHLTKVSQSGNRAQRKPGEH